MGDKKPSKSVEGVTATLESCGLQTDASSRTISASLIAGNLANGATGVKDITSGVRILPNVGQCVADQYDGKKPDLGDRVGAILNSFKAAATDLADLGRGVARDVMASAEPAIRASQPGTNPGVTPRGATVDQFCANVDANGGVARDVTLAMQKCDGPKARMP